MSEKLTHVFVIEPSKMPKAPRVKDLIEANSGKIKNTVITSDHSLMITFTMGLLELERFIKQTEAYTSSKIIQTVNREVTTN